MSIKTQFLSVVFSFRNEEKNIGELVKRVSKSISVIDNINYELVGSLKRIVKCKRMGIKTQRTD